MDNTLKLHHTSNKLYLVWNNLRNRCYNKNYDLFHRYGARGITVCDSWKDSFDNFYNDMIYGYEAGLSLDRIDNNKGYSKENCRWVTARVQANNTTKNRNITYNGITKSMAEWARELGIKYKTLSQRINAYGWSYEKALGGYNLG